MLKQLAVITQWPENAAHSLGRLLQQSACALHVTTKVLQFFNVTTSCMQSLTFLLLYQCCECNYASACVLQATPPASDTLSLDTPSSGAVVEKPAEGGLLC